MVEKIFNNLKELQNEIINLEKKRLSNVEKKFIELNDNELKEIAKKAAKVFENKRINTVILSDIPFYANTIPLKWGRRVIAVYRDNALVEKKFGSYSNIFVI